jgi:broad specificity phosphatase PhoE
MTEKTRIYLIRHGEVQGAGTRRYNGHADVPLSERGIAQYHQMKERLADKDIVPAIPATSFAAQPGPMSSVPAWD